MFGRLIEIIIFFFVIYFIYNVIRAALGFSRGVKSQRQQYEKQKRRAGGDGKVIELDKDQYKVE